MSRPAHLASLARGLLSLVAATALLALGACQGGGQSPSTTMTANPNQQFQELLARPDIEEIIKQYERMSASMRDKLVAEIGLPPWKERTGTGGSSGCRNYPDVRIPDAQSRGLNLWASEANLPDDKWPRAGQIVAEIASGYEFGAPATVADVPGQHEISLKDKYGAEITFGTRVHTSLLIQTGCHLTPEAHRRGTPSGGS